MQTAFFWEELGSFLLLKRLCAHKFEYEIKILLKIEGFKREV